MDTIEVYNYLSVSKMIEEKEIDTMLVHIPFKLIDDSILIIEFDDFVSFLIKNQIKQVFIHEQYVEIEEYMIKSETFRKLGVDRFELEYLEEHIEEYNDIIANAEIEIPDMVIVVCIWNGQRFHNVLLNEILVENEVLVSAEEKLAELIMNHKQEIAKANELKKELIETQKQQLQMHILKDSRFKECTNNRMRQNYIKEIFVSDKAPKELKDVWMHHNFLCHEAYDFIETIWRDYKKRRI